MAERDVTFLVSLEHVTLVAVTATAH